MANRSIFILGAFSPGQLGYSYQRAFESLGLQTRCFEMVNNPAHPLPWTFRNHFTRNRITIRLTKDLGAVRSRVLRTWNDQLVAAALESGAGTVLSLSMRYISADSIDKLRRQGIRVVMFYPDNPFPPHYGSRPETLPAARAADLCLVWSKRLVIKLREAGVRRAEFLPFGWDPECFPWEEDQLDPWPGVVFLGSWDREREEFLEQLAARVPLRIFGPWRWGRRTNPGGRVRECWQGIEPWTTDAARIIRQSAVCINILRTQHIIDGHPDAVIMRHFEVPGAGGFLLSSRDGTATSLFPEGRTAEYYSDIDECVSKANWYMKNMSERRALVQRAHAEVAACHRYLDRAGEILSMLEESGY